MKMNLKKARKLESKIDLLINDERPVSSERVRINAAMTDIELKILQGRQKLLEEVDNKQKLIELRFKIRRLIAVANEQSGVSGFIADKVMLAAKKRLVNIYLSQEVGYDKEELDDVIEQQRTELKKEGSFMRSKSALAEVHVLTEANMDTFKESKLTIEKQIEELDDKLAELNYLTKIELEQADIDLLKLNKLI